MKNFFKEISKEINLSTVIAVLVILVFIVATAMAEPAAAPPSANVGPTFSSLTIGTGGFIQLPATGTNRMTGSFARWIGNTSYTSNGKMTGGPGGLTGYSGIRDICAAGFASTYSGSHVCTAREIINSYEYGSTPTPPATGYAWINNGPPSYDAVDSTVNDCFGWTSDNSNDDLTARFNTTDSAVEGSVWNFEKKAPGIINCDTALAIACCSY
jgi:hypothetical protein